MDSPLDLYLARFSPLVRGRKRRVLSAPIAAQGDRELEVHPRSVWVERSVAAGATVVTVDVPDTREADRLRRLCSRLRPTVPFGNVVHPETVRYTKAAADLAAGPPSGGTAAPLRDRRLFHRGGPHLDRDGLRRAPDRRAGGDGEGHPVALPMTLKQAREAESDYVLDVFTARVRVAP